MSRLKEPSEAAAASCRHCGLPVAGPPRRTPSSLSEPLFCCLGCRLAAAVSSERGDAGAARWTLAKIGLAVFFSMNVMVFTLALWSHELDAGAEATALHELLRRLALLFTAPVVLLLGGPLLESAWDSLRRRRPSTDVLLLLGVLAAFATSLLATWQGRGHVYFEVVCGVLVAVTLGRWLEATGKQKTTETLRSLQRLLPETVRRLADGGSPAEPPTEQPVGLDEVRAGDRYRVVAGERIATDGLLVRGPAVVDQQLLTGESAPIDVPLGDPLLGGSLNLSGDIVVEATSDGGHGALARLVEAVERAAARRPAIQRSADRIAAWLTPLVMLLAVVALAAHWSRGAGPATMTALSVVLIACPCGLAVATPLAFWAAIGAAARSQVLLRSGDSLARLARVRRVCLDKTGTLTVGEAVSAVHPADGLSASDVLAWAARLAASSNHPVSAAVTTATSAAGCASAAPLPGAVERPGRGVLAAGPGGIGALGSPAWIDELAVAWPEKLVRIRNDALERGQSVAAVVRDNAVCAVIELSERWREDAIETIKQLRAQGLAVTVLTGDRSPRAHALSRQLGTLGVEIRAEMTPEEKLAVIRSSEPPVAMVGDGVNDAPALAAATAGVALASGADVSRDHADVCLLGEQLLRLPWAIDLSRRTMRIARRNLFWSLAYNTVGLTLAMGGRLHPAVAAAAMVLSSLWVIGHSLPLSTLHFETQDGLPDAAAIDNTTAPADQTAGASSAVRQSAELAAGGCP